MGILGVHQNIPAFDTNLTPILGISFISPPLLIVIFIPVNSRAIRSAPKINLLLEVERTPTVTIKPRLILVTHTDHLSRNKTLNCRAKCIFNLSTGLSSLQILRQGSSPITSQTADQLTRYFKSTLLLTHKLGIACAI